MRIAVACHSPLLQKALELFLENYLSSAKKCDIIIRDEACLNDPKCFYIGSTPQADLLKPFSKSQLVLALEKRYRELYKKEESNTKLEGDDSVVKDGEKMDFSILERRIEALTQEYQANILRAVRAFYEK